MNNNNQDEKCLIGPFKNNPKHKKIFIKVNNETRFLGEIKILTEGGMCFFPTKLDSLIFFGNGIVHKWPLNENHITFHNSGRVHIGNKNVVFDYGYHDTCKNKSKKRTRDSIANHNPQLLLKLRIPKFNFLEEFEYKKESGDILLEFNNKIGELLFTCGIFNGNDPFGIKDAWKCINTFQLGFGEFEDITKIKDRDKKLLLIIQDFKESSISEKFKEYPYCMSVTTYTEKGDNPY